MEEVDIKRLALVIAIQTEVVGMEHDNRQNERDNCDHRYTKEHFDAKAEELRTIAYTHRDQL